MKVLFQRLSLAGIISLGLLAGRAHAAVVFSLFQAVPGPITVGTTSVFDIFISSNTGPVNIFQIDFDINANHNFVAGTTAGPGYFFDPGDSFWNAFGSTTNTFSGIDPGAGQPLGAIPTRLGSITLSAVGAVPGTYSISLANLFAADLGGEIPTFNPGPLSYTIAADVPEPASALLLLAGACGIARRRKQRAVPVSQGV